LAEVRRTPTVDEPLKCLHEEDSGAACRVEDLQVPGVATPREHLVENEVDRVLWRGR
jgi:hypothetical protein